MTANAHARRGAAEFCGHFFIEVFLVGAVVANLGFLAGCGGGGSSGSSGEVITASTSSTPQSVPVGAAFQLLQVQVTNGGTPVGNVSVTFTAPANTTAASGTFANGSATDTETTNADGIAGATTFTANTIAGSYSVTASASGAMSATFSLSNTALAPAKITATTGSNQTAALGVPFANDLAVTVVDIDGNPVSGAVVTFTAPSTGASAMFAASSGTGAPGAGPVATATTNASGVATSPTLTAATAIGTYNVAATVSGVTTAASFSLTNTVGAAGAVEASNGSPQYAVISTAFVKPLQATVVDEFSDPISGVNVTFTAVASGGASGKFANGTATETDTTDSNGMATSSTFTANAVQGCYTVTASGPAGAGIATFNLSNVIPSVAANGVAQTATVNTTFATQLQSTVTGSAGGSCGGPQPLTGITVTYTAPTLGASGKFSDTGSNTTTAVTNALGVANAAPFTANGTAGPYTVVASIPAASSGANFSLDNTAAVTLAVGTYVFFVSGTDNLGSDGVYPYSLAGAVQVGTGGTVTGGELDFNNYFYADYDLINGPASTISQGTDGNFILTLTTCNVTDCTDSDLNAGVAGVITLDVALLPSSSHQGFVTEFDSAATGSGTFDFQTSTSLVNGGYAFALNGLDPSGEPLAIGGVIDVSGTSVASGEFDANDAETLYVAKPFSPGTISSPDSLGRVSIALMAQDSADFPEIGLAGYTADGSSVRLVETADSYLGGLGGSAYSQGSTIFASGCTLGTSYVVGLNGIDTVGKLQAAALLTLSISNCTVSGFISYNDLTGLGAVGPSAITGGNYSPDGTGRITLSNLTDGTNTFNLQLYRDGSGHATAISMDMTDVLGGVGYQQTVGSFTASNFNGPYAMSATGWDPGLQELDEIGQPITADGSSAFSGSFDLNWLSLNPLPAELPDKSLNGAFTSVSTGVFIGTIKGLDVSTCNIFVSGEVGCSTDNFDYYLIDAAGDSIAIETDTNQLTLGYFFKSQPN